MKKSASLIIGFTALATIILIVIVYFIVGALSPISLAKMYENVNSNISIKYYIKNYEKNKNINNLYAVVDKSISMDKDDVLIEYYPLLLQDEGYTELINNVNELNYDENASVKQNLFLSNEDNRLKTRYVSALSEQDTIKAFEFAYDDFKNNTDNFAFIGLRNVIESIISMFDSNVVNGIVNRFNDLIDEYDTIKNNQDISTYEKAYQCYNCLEICQFILLLGDNNINIIDSDIFNQHKSNLATDLSIYIL